MSRVVLACGIALGYTAVVLAAVVLVVTLVQRHEDEEEPAKD